MSSVDGSAHAGGHDYLAFETATVLCSLIREKKISCVDLTSLFLRRIKQNNPALRALVFIDAKGAMSRAAAADAALVRGDVWGPLHGLPVTLKVVRAIINPSCTHTMITGELRRSWLAVWLARVSGS